MKVKDVMSTDAIRHCAPETSLAHAARIMKENNRGALPIVDASEKVVGIITDRDICLSLSAKPEKPASQLRVQDVVPREKLQTILPEQPLADALRIMRTHKIGRLPVTDTSGRLKGVLSINNILKHAIAHKSGIGTTAAGEESLARTINALFERNNSHPVKREEVEMTDEE